MEKQRSQLKHHVTKGWHPWVGDTAGFPGAVSLLRLRREVSNQRPPKGIVFQASLSSPSTLPQGSYSLPSLSIIPMEMTLHLRAEPCRPLPGAWLTLSAVYYLLLPRSTIGTINSADPKPILQLSPLEEMLLQFAGNRNSVCLFFNTFMFITGSHFQLFFPRVL